MDFVQYFPTQIIWAHREIAPWGGWLLSVLILVLGFRWFGRTLRRAGRSIKKKFDEWSGRRRVTREMMNHHRETEDLLENCATPGLIDLSSSTRVK